MIAACRRIGKLVTRIQEAYLEQPELGLTLHQAEARFRLDAVTCRALFELLCESGVLTRTNGVYRLRHRSRPRGRRPGLQAAA